MIGWRWPGPTGISRDLFEGVRERLQPPPPPAAKRTKGGRRSSPTTAARALAPTPVVAVEVAAVFVKETDAAAFTSYSCELAV